VTSSVTVLDQISVNYTFYCTTVYIRSPARELLISSMSAGHTPAALHRPSHFLLLTQSTFFREGNQRWWKYIESIWWKADSLRRCP